MPRGTRRQGGFTLLEVVVAMALFSMLMTVLYSGFGVAVRAYEAADERGDSAARMRVVSDFLRRSLTAAFPMAIADRQDWSMIFEGSEQRVRFVADMPGYLGVGGLHEIVVESERTADGEQLVMRRRPLSVDRDGELVGEYEDHVLLEALGGVAMRYFGAPEERAEPRWLDEWPVARRMPELIELAIRDVGGEPWPPLLVRPQVDTVRYQSASAPGVEAEVPQQPDDPAAGDAAEPLPVPNVEDLTPTSESGARVVVQ